MFNVAFGDLSKEESFDTIPVAVVLDESADVYGFVETINLFSEEWEDQFLNATFTTEDEAMALLEDKEIIGILYEGSPVTMTVSAEMSSNKLEQSI